MVPRVYGINNRTNISFTDNIQRNNTQATVSFTDRATTALESVDNPLETTYMLADTSDTVDSFFQRPQAIFTEEWIPGVSFHQIIDPWSLFFENPRVAEKLSNFYLLRARLHIKVVVNSSPFYYGRLMVSYNPLAFIDSYTFNRPGIQQDFIQASQRPNVVINPAADEVAELVLPYMYPKSALSIPAQEWKNMGNLTIADLNMLQNANNATDSITVTVFAWAEDVSYSQPTSVPITVQGEIEDTHPAGVISAPATSLARLSTSLANLPIIGKYAKATSLMSNAVASIASLFGMSRPRQVAPHQGFVNDGFRRFTNVNNTDICETLALDSKQEVTIDPRVVGCDPFDQMALVPLAKRESYLTTFVWENYMPPQQLLFNTPVTPLMFGVNGDQAFFTPMGWVALPFRYWRGSLRFRFEVVASKFHRGRLRVCYDPHHQQTTEYNVNYTKLVDIADGADFTVEVGWAQGLPYLIVPPVPLTAPMFGNTAITGNVAGANGILSMFVVNSLTAPSETVSNAYINVYVSACDDFEVQAPNAGNLIGLVINQNGKNPQPVDDGGSGNPNVPDPPGYGTTLGSYVHYIQPGGDKDVLAPRLYGYGAICLGANNMVKNFDGSTTLSLNGNLESVATPYDLTFQLVAANAAPATVKVTIGGVPYTSTFGPNGSDGIKKAIVTYTVPANTTTANFLIESIDGQPWTTPLCVENMRAKFNFPSATFRMDDLQGSVVSGSAEKKSDSEYTWWELAAGAKISLTPPAGSFNCVMAKSDLGATLTFEANSAIETVAVGAGDNPRQFLGDTTNLPVTGNLIITNTGANPVGVYGLGMKAVPVQGDLSDIETMAGTSEEKPVLSSIFFGESVTSIRQILKRYTVAHFIPPLPTPYHYQKAFPMLPVSYAKVQLARVEMSLWKWFVPAFVGWKGSTRTRITGNFITGTITRLPLGAENYESRLTPAGEGVTNTINWNGSTIGFSNQTPLAAELPWYSNKRFLPARAAAGNSYFEPEMAYQVDIFTNAVVSNPTLVTTAIGEDFSTYMFLCTPVVSPSP